MVQVGTGKRSYFFLVITLTDYSTWKQFRVLNLDPSESARFDLARTDGAVKSKQDAPGQDRGMGGMG